MKRILLFAVISVLIVSVSVISISAQFQSDIPVWVKGVANFWVEGNISDSEFGESISFLIEQNILHVEMPNTDDYQNINTIRNLEVENKKLEAENKKLKQENAELKAKLDLGIDNPYFEDSEYLDNGCPRGYPYIWSDGLCYNIAETVYDEPEYYPELLLTVFTDKSSYQEEEMIVISGWTTVIIGETPVTIQVFVEGSLVDIVQVKVSRDGSYSHLIIAEGPLWKEVGDYLIRVSYGAGNIAETKFSYTPKPSIQPSLQNCDPSYPDVCIPPYPPDLDCDEISYSNFRVTGYDPHGFDTDYDGIGCEVGSPSSSQSTESAPSCDPSYPDVCIPPYPPDLDCGEISYSNFRVVGSDPHGFDRDNDGIGCES